MIIGRHLDIPALVILDLHLPRILVPSSTEGHGPVAVIVNSWSPRRWDYSRYGLCIHQFPLSLF